MANERSLSTRERLLASALPRFARDGWAGTSIRDLAADVGIRESSVYKHFSSKQAILDALLTQADARLGEVAAELAVNVQSPTRAASDYAGISIERLTAIAVGFFDAMLHDPELASLRRMFVVGQYRDPTMGRALRDYWIERPIAFQTALFGDLMARGEFLDGLDPEQTALAFFGPVLTLLQLAESGGVHEERARELLVDHVLHFRRTHLREP